MLDVVTACTRYCWMQLLPVPITVERSHCLCPLMLNAATACARYSWTQSPPLPVTVERIYFLAHYCWTQSLPLPVAVERIYFLGHYYWTQLNGWTVPVTVKTITATACARYVTSSHCCSRYCWTQSLSMPLTASSWAALAQLYCTRRSSPAWFQARSQSFRNDC
jgi:hypothetical protein